MREIVYKTEDKTLKEIVYNCNDFPYSRFMFHSLTHTSRKGKHKEYIELVCTFDIETTSINNVEKPYGFMYVWQFCVDDVVCIGRTWEELQIFIERLCKMLNVSNERNLVIYVHFLPFEFQFFRNFFPIHSVFATDKRNVIKVVIDGGIEFRCSYRLSNMGLDKFCKNSEGVIHKKKNGKDFDYSIIRTPSTYLTDEELGYCVCDVVGLAECIKYKMKSENDNLATIPLTSTGYVRRDFRKSMRKNEENRKKFEKTKLTSELYVYCKTATRGGNAHLNPIYNNEIIENVQSYDKKSSYPYQMACKKFPSTPFIEVDDYKNYNEYIRNGEAILLDVVFENLKIKTIKTIPYIPKSKCTICKNARIDNGRVTSADLCGMVLTDIDYDIILNQYKFDNIKIKRMFISKYELLPYEFREHLMDMFLQKTMLENGDKYLYSKYKNKINSSFGMMLTDICKPNVIYKQGMENCWDIEDVDIEKTLKHYYNSRNSFLSYQHGIWVTAHARSDLQESIEITGADTIYVDTDSNKHRGDYQKYFNNINERIIKEAEKFDVKPFVELEGKKTYLGVWEKDGEYKKFKSLGSKKYCYEDKKGFHITVAGLSKKTGAEYIEKIGGMEKFAPNTVIPKEYSGRTTSHYNDNADIFKIKVNDDVFTTSSNLSIENVSYTFSISKDYEDFLEYIRTL